MDELDKRLAEASEAASEAAMGTELALLKIKLFQMALNLKTEDYEEYKNLEARIRELEGNSDG
jgi:hypothetical protein